MVRSQLFWLLLVPVVVSSICGRNLCDSCISAKLYVPHWSGNSAGMEGFMDCSSFLGNDYNTIKSLYMDVNGQFQFIDTDTIKAEYVEWLAAGGSTASITCKNTTAKLLCMNHFPPCISPTKYAVFPCKQTCLEYEIICMKNASPRICPTDGPDYGSSNPGHGIYPLSNNAILSCYSSKRIILPSRCLADNFTCNTGFYHPECIECVCPNGYTGRSCDACSVSSQCTHSLSANQTCWTDPADILINLPQTVFNTSLSPRAISCRGLRQGILSTYLGYHRVYLERVASDQMDLKVESTWSQINPEILHCSYTKCEVISSLQCSIYISTLNPCIRCSAVRCETAIDLKNNPFGILFDYLESSAVFGCDGDQCVWQHQGVFEQNLQCTAGVCLDDISPTPLDLTAIIILAVFLLIFLFIILVVCMTPGKVSIITPVTQEVKKTMSYARMSTHLLSPLMECDEGVHTSFLGSYINLQPSEYVWYDVQVIDPDAKIIVNSRIGSINNATGLYAVVGPTGTHTRHLLRALCGLCDVGNKVNGTFYMNGSLLQLTDLLRETSYVSGCNDMCPELTVREIIENAFMLTQPPWVSSLETEGKVDSLLADLHLVKQQHSAVKSLRRDQAMILRICIEVLTKSSVIVLDDPFVSFTPSMTMNVLKYLKRAQKSGVIILLAFSQPRSMVLQFIQNIILMGPQANVLYSGPVAAVERYFLQFDLQSRGDMSDSDYLLDVVSGADDFQLERMISAYRNSDDNKLLLLNMRHIRRESVTNLRDQKSFIRISDALTLDNATTSGIVTGVLPQRPSSVGRTPFSRLSPRIDVNAEDSHTTGVPLGMYRGISPKKSEKDMINGLSVAKKLGSMTRVPSADGSSTSIYSLYDGIANIPSSSHMSALAQRLPTQSGQRSLVTTPLLSTIQRPLQASAGSRPASPSVMPSRSSPLAPGMSPSSPITQPHPVMSSIPESLLSPAERSQHSISGRSNVEDWSVSPRVKYRILLSRIVHCLLRDKSFVFSHTIAAFVLSVAIGLFFWQIPANSEGVGRREVLLIIIVLYSVLQGMSARNWYKKDLDVFVRESRCGYISPMQYFIVVAILERVLDRVLPSLMFVLNGIITVFSTGLCMSDSGSDFTKIMLFLMIITMSMSLMSSFFSLSYTLSNKTYSIFILILIVIQIMPMFSNMWNIRGWWSLITLFFPLVLIKRALMLVEFTNLSIVFSLWSSKIPITRVMGMDILNQNGIDGHIPLIVSMVLLVLYDLLCQFLLFVQLLQAVVASPVTTYKCVKPEPHQEEMETSSSEIRIESDDEQQEVAVERGDITSTKVNNRRVRIDSAEMNEDAGLEI